MRLFIHHSRRLASSLRRRSSCIGLVYLKGVRSLSNSPHCVDKTVSIPVGNNGFVSLRVTRPPASSPSIDDQSSPGPNVVLYLPPGPLFRGFGADSIPANGESVDEPESDRNWDVGSSISIHPSPQHILASITSATVVTVNYRLGTAAGATLPGLKAKSDLTWNTDSDDSISGSALPAEFHRYPTPVHDTLAGFDWIQTRLRPAQLGVFGQHIGGSLALMLALTEAQNVRAVTAFEPVCDWPGLDEYCTTAETGIPEISANKKQKRSSKKTSRSFAPPDLVPLLEARERFFSSPERCFDAFASPILFLRSAGRDVPRTFPRYLTGPEYPVPVMKDAHKTTSAEQRAAPSGSLWDRDVYPDVDVDEELEGAAVTVSRRRKALSRWPPHGLDYDLSGQTWSGPGHGVRRMEVQLPWVRVFLPDKHTGLSSRSDDSSHSAPKHKSPRTVLDHQGEEMVSVMQRACFFGMEKGFGERKVTISRVDGNLEREVGDWLCGRFNDEIDE